MSSYSRRVLVGDFGGTNLRFAISDLDELTIDHFAALRTADFSSPQAALAQYLRSIPNPPSLVAVAVAGPVSGDHVQATQLPWAVSEQDIRAATGAEHVFLINNFQAVATMVPMLMANELHVVGSGVLRDNAPRAIIGPGTGLGVAGLLHSDVGWTAIASEGGHMSFGGMDRAEIELLDKLGDDAGYRSAEQVLCGAGMVALYRVLARQTAQSPDLPDTPLVVKAGLSGHNPAAQATLQQFATWLGRFAGDVALQFAATGGVYLGGGIPPAMLPVLTSGSFRKAFENKGRLSPFMAEIPVYVIRTSADSGLRGAALAMAQQAPFSTNPRGGARIGRANS